MSTDERRPASGRWEDVRLRGFADRVPLERAQAWADGRAARLPAEWVATSASAGRVLAEAVAAPRRHPPADRAAEDGWALRAAETVGASGYNPLPFAASATAVPLPPGSAARVAAGESLPPGADAVLPFDLAQDAADGAGVEVVGAVAAGVGVERAGEQVEPGAPLLEAGRAIGLLEAAQLAAAGVERLRAVARPRVRLLSCGPKAAGEPELHAPLVRALVDRDGGVLEVEPLDVPIVEAFRRAARPGADLLLVTGRTGTGADDEVPPALARAGTLELHGVAIRPGGSAGMGSVGALPLLLLPGDPLACWGAYELLAGRLVRQLGGRPPALPHRTAEVELGRKLVSSIGLVEIVPVRLAGGRAEPLGLRDFGGLGAAAGADGFVVVPAALEGHPPGARTTVLFFP